MSTIPNNLIGKEVVYDFANVIHLICLAGHFMKDRDSRCPCKNGPKCDNCQYCLGCSCRCHTWFVVNQRLMSLEHEQRLLEKVRATAESNRSDDAKNKLKERISLVEERLEHAKQP